MTEEKKDDENQNPKPAEPYAIDRKGAKVGVGDTVIIACRVGGVRGDHLSLVSNYFTKQGEEQKPIHDTFYAQAAVCEMVVDTNEDPNQNQSGE